MIGMTLTQPLSYPPGCHPVMGPLEKVDHFLIGIPFRPGIEIRHKMVIPSAETA